MAGKLVRAVMDAAVDQQRVPGLPELDLPGLVDLRGQAAEGLPEQGAGGKHVDLDDGLVVPSDGLPRRQRSLPRCA